MAGRLCSTARWAIQAKAYPTPRPTAASEGARRPTASAARERGHHHRDGRDVAAEEVQLAREGLAVLAKVEGPELGERLDPFAHAESLRPSSAGVTATEASTGRGVGAWTVRIWWMNDQCRQAPRITAR